MAVAVVMPRQGQSVETCFITKWHKSIGDSVVEGDLLFSYETDKAAFDEEAKESGVLLEIFFQEGEEVPVLANVAVIGQSGENYRTVIPSALAGKGDEPPDIQVSEKPAAPLETASNNGVADNTGASARVASKDENKDVSALKGAGAGGRIRISPLARRIAGELDLSVDNIAGTGPMGRIIERDILKAAAGRPAAPARDGKDFTVRKLSNVRRIIAGKMAASLHNSAQLTHHMSADARRMLELRKEIKAGEGTPGYINISINDMVCFAVIKALKKHPDINAHFMGDSIRSFSKVHLGIAVDTERGLMVPVLRNADELNVGGLARHIKMLADECRKGSIDPELLSGEAASFTVSNLGAYGVEMFTPVLNLPQVGILGVNTIVYRPSDLGSGTIGIVPVIGLSLTYDHRAIDGAPASVFLREVKEQIENI